MRITNVKSTIVEGNFDWLLVKIETDSGINGYGESFAAHYSKATEEVVSSVKDALVGEDPMDVERLTAKMIHAKSYIGGLTTIAISGIDIALWDVAGKALNVPVYRLLGGKFRDRIRMYCDCHAGHPISSIKADYSLARRESYTPEAYAEHARSVKRLGFDFLKFDIYPNVSSLALPYNEYHGHLSEGQVKFLASLMGAAREAIGHDTELSVDFGGYSTHDAIRLGNALEPYRLAWIEDVVPENAENADALLEVTRSVKTPTLTGELLFTQHGFREILERQAIRIAAPDFGTVGGLTEGKKIAYFSDAYFIPLAPHNIASPIGTFAACQLCATIPNFIALEWHAVGVPWWEDLAKGQKPIIKNGHIHLSNSPGIGVEPNIDAINKHLKKGEEPLD